MINTRGTKKCFRVISGGKRLTSADKIHLSQKDWTTLCGLSSRNYYGVVHSKEDRGRERCRACYEIAVDQGLESVPYNSLGLPVEREIESAE